MSDVFSSASPGAGATPPSNRLAMNEAASAGFPRDAQGMAANALPKGLQVKESHIVQKRNLILFGHQDVLPKLSKSQMAGQPAAAAAAAGAGGGGAPTPLPEKKKQ